MKHFPFTARGVAARATLALAAAVAVGALGALALLRDDPAPTKLAAPSTAPTAPPIMSYPRADGAVQSAAPAPAAPPIVASKSKAQQISELVATGQPTMLFAAYRLAADCVQARFRETSGVFDAMPKTGPGSSAVCGDIEPGQITQRVQWAQAAAEAGVHGAALAAVEDVWRTESHPTAGGGRAISYPPEWSAHMLDLMEKAAATGDWESSLYLVREYENSRDREKALTYASAWAEAARSGPAPRFMAPTAERAVTRLAAGLSPEKAAAAIEAGKQMAAKRARS